MLATIQPNHTAALTATVTRSDLNPKRLALDISEDADHRSLLSLVLPERTWQQVTDELARVGIVARRTVPA